MPRLHRSPVDCRQLVEEIAVRAGEPELVQRRLHRLAGLRLGLVTELDTSGFGRGAVQLGQWSDGEARAHLTSFHSGWSWVWDSGEGWVLGGVPTLDEGEHACRCRPDRQVDVAAVLVVDE